MTREPPLPLDWDCASCAALQAEIERLLGVCKDKTALLKDAYAEVERLKAALQRIDGINDNPSTFNVAIEEVLRAALEPKP